METIRFDVPDVHCGNCKASIERAVQGATVDLEAKTVTVTSDAPDVAAITTQIEDLGYEVAGVHQG